MSKKTIRLSRGLSGLEAGPAEELKFEYCESENSYQLERLGEDLEPLTTTIERLVDRDGELLLKLAGKTHRVFWHRDRETVYLALGGRHYRYDRASAAAIEVAGDDASHAEIKAPMTGTIVKVLKSQGDAIAEGETVVIVEAMKMEHELRAPFDAVVESLDGKEGDQVDLGQILARLERS